MCLVAAVKKMSAYSVLNVITVCVFLEIELFWTKLISVLLKQNSLTQNLYLQIHRTCGYSQLNYTTMEHFIIWLCQ